MTEIKNLTGKEAVAVANDAGHGKHVTRRPYVPPQIVSAERLEAAAATCDPPVGGFGKHVPTPCGTHGS